MNKVLTILNNLEKPILSFLSKINIGKRLIILILIILISIVTIITYQSINIYTDNAKSFQKEKLAENMNMTQLILNNRRRELLGYVEAIANMPKTREVLEENSFSAASLLNNIVLNKLNLEGIEFRDKDLNIVNSFGISGVEFEGKEDFQNYFNARLNEKGSTESFFTEKGFSIQLNAMASVLDEYRIATIGTVVISTSINQNIMKDVSQNTNSVIQLYKGDRLIGVSDEKLKDTNLINSKVIDEINDIADSKYLFKEIEVNDDYYIASYLPLSNYSGGNIGYIVLLSSQKDTLLSLREMVSKTILKSVIFIMVSFVLIILISRSITVPLNKITEITKRVAAGDLTTVVDIKTNDQLSILADNFNLMVKKLKNITSNIISVSEDISNMSKEFTEKTEEVNEISQEVNIATEEMGSSIEQISASTQEVTVFAEEASSKTVAGSNNIQGIIESIIGINKEVQETVTIIYQLDENSKEINKIIGLINSISEQINLLALNAAIEAARVSFAIKGSKTSSGEAGKGFAVVADEIGSLAKETSQAIGDIVNLLKKTQLKTKDGLKSIEEVKNKAQQGEIIATEAGEVFEEIERRSKDTSANIEETAVAIEDLVGRNNEIVNSNYNIKNMLVEVSSPSNQLEDMAEKLQSLVSKFKV